MRKLLSLVLAFAMILGLFTFPVSADATTYQTVGQELAGLGVLKGVDAKGTLAEMQKLTREQALVVLTRLMGQEDKALATDAQPGFTDVPATHWSAKYVAYAKLQGWTNGTSETQFGLGSDVTTKQVVTLMMRALGYTADWSKEDVVKKAQELGLLEGVSATPDDAIIRGELFIVMKNTLYTKPMGEKIELIYKLGLAENPIPSTLEVVDVKATNLKEVVVEFNQEVDKTTLEDAFSAVGYTLGTITPELQEDGKTVLLTVGRLMKNKENYKVTISKVKSLSGLALEKVTKEFKTQDNEVPKVEKIEVTGPRNFQIIFSEPIKTTGTVKLKLEGKNAAGVAVKQDPTSERKFDATVASNLQDGKTYTALVTGFTDFANYKNIDSEIEFEYAKVTDAPVAEVVKATQEYVVFKFNRPVKGLKLENFYHTYSAWKPVASYNSVEEMDKDSDKRNDVLDPTKARNEIVVRFIHTVDEFVKKSNNVWHPLQVGDVEVSVLGQVGSRKVLDNWGNQLQDTELKVTISADKEAPVVEAVEVTGEKELEVAFSKKVLENRNNFELLNADGSKISGLAFTTSKEGKKIKLTVGSPKLVGKSVILNVKDVKDDTINMNKMVGVESFNVTFGDKTFEGLKEATLKFSNVPNTDYYSNPTLYVAFSEAVDPETAMNVKNYLFTKDITAEEGKKSFFGVEADTSMFSDSIVQLVMSRETFIKKFGSLTADAQGFYPVQVYASNNIKDAAGNSYGPFAKFVKIKSASAAPVITKNEVKVTGYRTVEYSYNLPIITKGFEIDKNQFAVVVKGKKKEIDSVEIVGTKGVKITLKDEKYNNFMEAADLAGDTTVSYKANTSAQGKDKAITNELGTYAPDFTAKLDGSPKLVDELSPAFMQGKVVNGDDVNDITYQYMGGHSHKVSIKFNEPMNDKTFSIHTFKVTGTDGSSYTPSDWKLVDGDKTLELIFKTSSEASIKTLAQQLEVSLQDYSPRVNANFGNGEKTYYQYFNVQLQEHNSAKDKVGNGFTSTDVYPVYHTKETAQNFIKKSGDLKGLENVAELGLKIVINGTNEDITGRTIQKPAAEIAAGIQLKAETAAGLGAVTYQWHWDGVNKGTAAQERVTKAGKATVTVKATKDGKAIEAVADVTFVSDLDKEQLNVPNGTPILTQNVGTIQLPVINNVPDTKARLFVNNAPDITFETPSADIMNKGENHEFNATKNIVAKENDVITIAVYEDKLGGKVIKIYNYTVKKEAINSWAALTGSNYLTAKDGSMNVILKKNAVNGVIEKDIVELYKNGSMVGSLTVGSSDAAFTLTEALKTADELKVMITRNGLKSELSSAFNPGADGAQVSNVDVNPAGALTKRGQFNGSATQATFILTLDDAELKSSNYLYSAADVALVVDLNAADTAKKGSLVYTVTEVTKVAGRNELSVAVKVTGEATEDLTQPLTFKFTVKGSARLDSNKDVAEKTHSMNVN